MKILIVDDEAINRELIKRLLQPYGEVTLATNGAEAVEAFRLSLEAGDPFRLIFMDIIMPVMDGVLAMKKIRVQEKRNDITIPRSAYIIMATSEDSASTQIEAKTGHGCNDYIMKPITKNKLLPILIAQQLIAA